ncbi:unnamed protein product [Amoebophrya sp. A120]|nr:unnamed protein product [Amoebophrya sp. A120]|eukprot:GSA120T00007467001.1
MAMPPAGTDFPVTLEVVHETDLPNGPYGESSGMSLKLYVAPGTNYTTFAKIAIAEWEKARGNMMQMGSYSEKWAIKFIKYKGGQIGFNGSDAYNPVPEGNHQVTLCVQQNVNFLGGMGRGVGGGGAPIMMREPPKPMYWLVCCGLVGCCLLMKQIEERNKWEQQQKASGGGGGPAFNNASGGMMGGVPPRREGEQLEKPVQAQMVEMSGVDELEKKKNPEAAAAEVVGTTDAAPASTGDDNQV